MTTLRHAFAVLPAYAAAAALLTLTATACRADDAPRAAAPAAVVLTTAATDPSRAETTAAMKRVFEWQQAHLRPRAAAGTDWVRGAYMNGVLAAYKATGDRAYLDAALAQSEANHWKPGPQPRHADDQCIGQTYADLYRLQPEPKDPVRIAALRAKLDRMMAGSPPPSKGPTDHTQGIDWWWCDALYMAPAAWMRVSAATGDPAYREYADKLYWQTDSLLWDPQEHLYFRDATYLPTWPRGWHKEKNGQKIFWSRGNGWVIAGLARLLQDLPDYHASRPKYVARFHAMADRLAALQGPDGLWRASLLDPESFPEPETSGTGLMCYAIAWGVNHGLLDRAKFEPVVKKAWRGLMASVAADGKLNWCQPPNGQPARVKESDTAEYGPGGFLLSGSEMLAMEK